MKYILCLLLFFLTKAFASPSFLLISDIHYDTEKKETWQSDSGPLIWQAALKKIMQLSHSVDFILNLGDLPAHLIVSAKKKEQDERIVFQGLLQADSSQKPMFYIPGNNDSLGGNYGPFMVKGRTPLDLAKDWEGACVYCSSLIIDNQLMRQEGYYSSYVIPGNKEVILIALNTASLVKMPFWQKAYWNQQQVAARQLSWLEKQLKTHKAKQLLIAMHIPPGFNYKGDALWRQSASAEFIRLLNKYASRFTEITLITGHTHMDELRQLVLPSGRVLYNYSVPSISRVHHNNPGMKVIALNNDMAVGNYTTYYTTSLTQWNDEFYQAKGLTHSIFSFCQQAHLASCLNTLSTEKLCHALEQGLFYGVKSKQVDQAACLRTYSISGNPLHGEMK
ncbi:MAG: metallophosphatase [Legionella sp.]|nr:MAG: metallophosphatase [Legionella sp.]PJD98360.1 MAG: metallophosphatase [Legionella sp.]